ncbi:MAG: putative Ig domain-containing protein [Candidatus Dormiibacterota bacterium]
MAAGLFTLGALSPFSENAVASSALAITTRSSPTSPPNATVSKAYSFTLQASGGNGSYTWALAGGALPGGLGLSAGGVISGTPTSVTQSGSFEAQVTSGGETATKAFSVWANPAPVSPFGKGFCTAHGATAEIEGPDNVWACGPAGAGFSPPTPYDSDGFQCVELSARFLSAVYGQPAANDALGDFNYGYEFVSSVATNPKHFEIDGKPIPETTTSSGDNHKVPSPGDIVSFGASGAWGFAEPTAGHTAVVIANPPKSQTPAGYFWILSQDFGSASEGFGITVGEQEINTNTTPGHALMVGLPSAPTPFSWLVLPTPTAAQPAPAANNPLTITTPSNQSSPPNATVGQPYGFDLEAAGPGSYPGLYEKAGRQLYYWSIAQGSLPPGLALSSNGTIAGTPTAVSQGGPFTVKVTAVGQVAEQSFTVWALPATSTGSPRGASAALQITTPTTIVVPQDAIPGTPFSYQFQAAGGTGTYGWSLALGSLPSGLKLQPSGVVSGTPSTGSHSATFVLQVSSGQRSAKQLFVIWVGAACGTIEGEYGKDTDVNVTNMTCGAAQQLMAAGGPLVATTFGQWHCTFNTGQTTFTATCTSGLLSITYTAPLTGGDPLSSLFGKQPSAVPKSALASGKAVYNDATCPSAQDCYAVGWSGSTGVVTATTNGGRTWTTHDVPGSGGLDAIGCASAQDCVVGGSAPKGAAAATRGEIFATDDGARSWKAESAPGLNAITSIACPSTSDCLAVAIPVGSTMASTLLATTDTGTTWSPETSPGSDLSSVRCVATADCWLAGPGVFFSSDLGQSWQAQAPPQPPQPTTPGFGIGSIYYSFLTDVEFQSASDGWAVGGDQCGGQGVTGCAGAAFHTVDGGATWTVSKASLQLSFGWQVSCQAASCLLVTQAFHSSELYSSIDNGSHWTKLFGHSGQINALACSPGRTVCILAGGSGGTPLLYTLG